MLIGPGMIGGWSFGLWCECSGIQRVELPSSQRPNVTVTAAPLFSFVVTNIFPLIHHSPLSICIDNLYVTPLFHP